MGKIKDINIKNRTSYFYDGLINIINMINFKDFDSNLLKIEKKSYKALLFITLDTSQ